MITFHQCLNEVNKETQRSINIRATHKITDIVKALKTSLSDRGMLVDHKDINSGTSQLEPNPEVKMKMHVIQF